MAKDPIRRFTVELDAELAKAFAEYVQDYGWIKSRVLAGCVRVFLSLPKELQMKVMALKNSDNAYSTLLGGLVDDEIRQRIAEIPIDQQQEFFELLRQAVVQARQKLTRKQRD
jgi:hypothetical protein